MKLCTIEIDNDAGPEPVLIIKPTLYARITGAEIVIFPNSYKEYKGKTIEIKEV